MPGNGTYLISLAAKLIALSDLKEKLEVGDKEARKSILRIIHQLRGSAGTLGYPEISETARKIEEHANSDDNLINSLDELIRVIREPLSRCFNTIYIIYTGNDESIKNQIFSEAAATGFSSFQHFQSGKEIEDFLLISGNKPSFIFLDTVLQDGESLTLLSRITKLAQNSCCVMLISSADENLRMESLALGARAVLEKPVNKGELKSMFVRNLEIVCPETGNISSNSFIVPHNFNNNNAKSNVLVIEDDSVVATLLRHWLTNAGYEVEIFSDGFSALERIRTFSPSLVILDVGLPGIDGFNLLRKLKSTPETSSIPCMILSAMGKEEDIARGLDLGAEDYIVKPFSPLELLARCRKILRRNSIRKTKKVLIVDDDEHIRFFIKEVLEQSGLFTVESAENGNKAIEIFNEDFDVALIDLKLPDIDGEQVFESFRRKKPDIITIFLSAEIDIQTKRKLLQSGAKDVVEKPLKVESFTDTISKLTFL